MEGLHLPRMKALYCLAAGLFLMAVSCESHDWEETKVLHEAHGDHGDHGDHGEGGDHAGDEPSH